LQEITDGQIRLRSTIGQVASRQRVEVGSDADYRMTLDAHELSSKATALVRLRRLAPEIRATTTSHTKFTARQDQQVETAIIDLGYDLLVQPSEPEQGVADQGPGR
jgi:hypothetical protein